MKWGSLENELGEGRVEINMIKNSDSDKVIKTR
jgi:hypothetical protein